MDPIVHGEVFTQTEYIENEHRIYGYPWYVAKAKSVASNVTGITELDYSSRIGSCIVFLGRRWVLDEAGNLTWVPGTQVKIPDFCHLRHH